VLAQIREKLDTSIHRRGERGYRVYWQGERLHSATRWEHLEGRGYTGQGLHHIVRV